MARLPVTVTKPARSRINIVILTYVKGCKKILRENPNSFKLKSFNSCVIMVKKVPKHMPYYLFLNVTAASAANLFS